MHLLNTSDEFKSQWTQPKGQRSSFLKMLLIWEGSRLGFSNWCHRCVYRFAGIFILWKCWLLFEFLFVLLVSFYEGHILKTRFRQFSSFITIKKHHFLKTVDSQSYKHHQASLVITHEDISSVFAVWLV